VLWLPERGALVFGDSFPGGPIRTTRCPRNGRASSYRAWLMPLLELPVELILPTHDDPGNRRLLEQTLV
jgi:hypothetical protein